ncbi:glycerate kinase family protein [Streptomonospora wellingtoniae]|uniref:Glycerate kinase n=1 Tax=Streptomonospora wellingtoniae TaxID=3075544 RepID=A0ABU2KP46_9ACTN|nr:glycerate kinase [Streptomonospora sp. DSM 45055]MDT0301038.1 glycerate kinase [Streptomonospora sp. DSM 45055]
MRIVIAPDKFAGTLSAVEAAEAVAEGWRSADPGVQTRLLPLSDGGPGFVEVLHKALGGTLHEARVTGPLGDPVPARYLMSGATAYIESAQACGLHLVPEDRRDPGRTTSRGVGELIARAVADGARSVVVGLGGSSTNDGGAGMLAALGAEPAEALSGGGTALARLPGAVGLDAAREAVRGISLVAATDVDNPLLGLHGASAVFGPQKGADDDRVQRLDAALAAFAEATDPGGLRDAPGAGAAGGLGYGMLLVGGTVESGIARVLGAVGLAEDVSAADLVITGEGSFDTQSLRGKLPHGVARAAADQGVPCVVLAGAVGVGRQEAAAAGIAETYSLVESAGSTAAAMSRSAEELRKLAADVARRWSGARTGAAGGAGGSSVE